ncbi:electron carrier/ protein disulfide oxidoreductase [Anaeramoeba flamelloides]|uniref:Electron carrier/ protein disulfide oxidoreductase n=1 Tax=Anaeramoeba flamelloides TaxID=1746091 RepID=A0AAV7YGS8_9EUKA|nr:electron carrier/ protein disulfide oxidoreductase [Anaeramoeba flamelloides]
MEEDIIFSPEIKRRAGKHRKTFSFFEKKKESDNHNKLKNQSQDNIRNLFANSLANQEEEPNSNRGDNISVQKRNLGQKLQPLLSRKDAFRMKKMKQITNFDKFAEILKHPLSILFYLEFLSKRKLSESFLFYLDVQRFKKYYSNKNSKKIIQYIFDTYLKPTSIFSIDLPYLQFKKIESNIKTNRNRNIFDGIKQKFEKIISIHFYKLFRSDNLFFQLLESDQKNNTKLKTKTNFDLKFIKKEKRNKILNVGCSKDKTQENDNKKMKVESKKKKTKQKKKIGGYSIVIELITILIDILKANISFSNNYINLKNLSKTTAFSRFAKLTKDLQRIDLNRLQKHNKKKKITFFINLYNLLFVHSLIKNNHPCDLISLEKFMYLSKYNVGGTIFTLADIKFGIFAMKSSISSNYSISNNLKLFKFEKIDPKVHFSLINITKESPLLTVYYEKYIDRQLSKTTKDFLENFMVIEPEYNQIFLPEIFEKNQKSFGNNKSQILLWIRKFFTFNDPFSLYFYELNSLKVIISTQIRLNFKRAFGLC